MLSVAIAVPQVSAAAEQTSENNAQLAKWLKRFPAADANGDGVLSRTEANEYRRQLQKKRSGADAQARDAGKQSLVPTEENVKYGEHERNVLDFFRAESDTPTPVLIYFHGGGFVGGDKNKIQTVALGRDCRAAGISVISANYRFVRGTQNDPGHPFPAPMLDGGRVIQFVRSKADDWHLDPHRIALAGGSAGACMSIWLAVHDDLADPASEDPIARHSTRVSAVVGYGGQTTLDPKIILRHIGGNPAIHSSLQPFYDVQSVADLDKPDKAELVQEASSLNYVSADDPPMFLSYGGRLDDAPLPATASQGASIHHAMFGKLVQDKYKTLGIACHLRCIGVDPGISELAFLQQCFGMDNGTGNTPQKPEQNQEITR